MVNRFNNYKGKKDDGNNGRKNKNIRRVFE